MEHLSLILRGRCSTCVVASAALGAPPERSAEVRRRLSTMDAGCFCVAGGALGAPQSHFAWQVQHLCRGKCSTRSTSREVRGSPATIEYYGRQVEHLEHLSLILCGRCSTCVVASAALGAPPERSAEVRRRLSTMDAGCFCVAGGALGAPQSHFAWQVQHLCRGKCSTRSTSREVRGSPATIEYYGRRLLLRGRWSTWSTSVSFCVAGAALVSWQVQHSEHLQRGPRKSGDD